MTTTLAPQRLDSLVQDLRVANVAFDAAHPGESGRRQPVHTVYGGAQLFAADTVAKITAVANRALREFAPDYITFGRAFGLPGSETLPVSESDALRLRTVLELDGERGRSKHPAAWLAKTVFERVHEKLAHDAVEDFRIDFEDGYGNRPDSEENGHAVSVATEVARAATSGQLPPFIGIRIKPLTEDLRARSIRTLDLFITTLARANGPTLPRNFVITLPKVTIPEQVRYMVRVLEALEQSLALSPRSLPFEIMIETPQSIIGGDGVVALPQLIEAGEGRIIGAHFGTYDYTAGCGITAAYQRQQHPACDFARHVMQVSLAGTGIWISDGSTAVLPVSPHVPAGGHRLSAEEIAENRASVHRAWRLHYDDVQHSLISGFYQGWDLHPAQLVSRYTAVYSFFLNGVDAAAERLHNFVEKATQATLVGDVFDDAATGQGLLNFFLRGINSGALTEEETIARTSLTLDELRGRSFVAILKNRRG